MRLRRENRLFEFFIVASVIGVVVLVAVNRYVEIGRETRRIGFELLSHNFTTAVANTHVHWLINRVQTGVTDFIELDGSRLYVSPAGWPASIDRPVHSVATELNARDCLRLWQRLLQNPMQASLEGEQVRGERRYHISLAAPGICRYELVAESLNSFYFDYSPVDGQVFLNVPPHKKIANL